MCAFVRFLKIFDVRIFVRLLAKICAHLSLELLDTLVVSHKEEVGGGASKLVDIGNVNIKRSVVRIRLGMNKFREEKNKK